MPHLVNPPSGYLVNCNNNSYTVTRDCPLDPASYPRHLMSRSAVLGPDTFTDRGSSWMQLVKYEGDTVEAETILPFGNSNDPASPHFADQMPLFASRKLKPALLTRPEIEAAATRRVVLGRP